MYLIYSILLAIGFLLMLPLFLVRREKYASGFSQRLGNHGPFEADGTPVVWLHCVSVGETNAARPLVDKILTTFPACRLIVSTTTKTGQELARNAFAGKAHAVFYFPFDWKFAVRKALRHFNPSAVLLMETEIWPRFIREAKKSGAKVAIVNGRLSERSAKRYSLAGPMIKRVLSDIDLALMQGENDLDRIVGLGLDKRRAQLTGNLKFDLRLSETEDAVTRQLNERFQIVDAGSSRPSESSPSRPLVVAASTHEPEERWLLEAFCVAAAGAKGAKPRLLIAPRHPQRFDAVAQLARDFASDQACKWPNYKVARRSEDSSPLDAGADVIILDSIGELRAIYPLAEIVFVGGSLIPHGGQSMLEPAAAGKAIITGHHTHNFDDIVRTFLDSGAMIQLPDESGHRIVEELCIALSALLDGEEKRRSLGLNAAAVVSSNRGATAKTVENLQTIFNDLKPTPFR